MWRGWCGIDESRMSRLPILLGALAGAVFVACTLPSPDEVIEKGRTFLLKLEATWHPSEVEQITSALEDWREVSAGRLDVRITSEGEDAVLLRRKTPIDAYAWYSLKERIIVIDGESLSSYEQGVKAMTMNIIGVIAGMRLHDGCGVLGKECVEPRFSEGDLRSCRERGYCS